MKKLVFAPLIALIAATPLAVSKFSEPELHVDFKSSAEATPGPSQRSEELSPTILSVATDYTTDLPDKVSELTATLQSMHLITVRSFESMPTFGFNRPPTFAPALHPDTMPAQHLPSISEIRPGWQENWYVRVREYGNADDVDGFQAWSWLHAMTWITSRGFVYPESALDLANENKWGFWRGNEVTEADLHFLVGLPMPSGGMDIKAGLLVLNGASDLKPEDQLWKLQRLELISTLTHDPPVAYEKSPPEFPDRIGKITIRQLIDIERKSLQRLEDGEEHQIAWSGDDGKVQFLGAVRAKESCLKCHESAKQGDLLGAFTYRLEEAHQ